MFQSSIRRGRRRSCSGDGESSQRTGSDQDSLELGVLLVVRDLGPPAAGARAPSDGGSPPRSRRRTPGRPAAAARSRPLLRSAGRASAGRSARRASTLAGRGRRCVLAERVGRLVRARPPGRSRTAISQRPRVGSVRNHARRELASRRSGQTPLAVEPRPRTHSRCRARGRPRGPGRSGARRRRTCARAIRGPPPRTGSAVSTHTTASVSPT